MDTNLTGTELPPGAQVLIVEDDPTTARYLELSLKRLGCQDVRVAATSRRALEMMREQPADLVLMDVDIDGDRDGIETTRLLRADYNVPVVFLTGYNDEITMARAKQVSPLAYLIKPVKTEELRATIASALAHMGRKKPVPGEAPPEVIAETSAPSTPTASAAPMTPVQTAPDSVNTGSKNSVSMTPVPTTPTPADDVEVRRLKAELAAVATHDGDTGLFNRRGFYLVGGQQLKLAARLAASMTLASLRVANLQAIESDFGATVREQVRQDLATLLRTTFPGDICARMDDDVFVVLTAERGRKETSDMLKAAVNLQMATVARAYKLQLQVKVAVRPADRNDSIADLLASATEVGEGEADESAKNKRRARR